MGYIIQDMKDQSVLSYDFWTLNQRYLLNTTMDMLNLSQLLHNVTIVVNISCAMAAESSIVFPLLSV